MTEGQVIAVRVGAYAAVFAAMALWEWRAPRRKLTAGRKPRWSGNLGILAIDIVAVRLLVPTTAVGVALVAAQITGACFPHSACPIGRRWRRVRSRSILRSTCSTWSFIPEDPTLASLAVIIGILALVTVTRPGRQAGARSPGGWSRTTPGSAGRRSTPSCPEATPGPRARVVPARPASLRWEA